MTARSRPPPSQCRGADVPSTGNRRALSRPKCLQGPSIVRLLGDRGSARQAPAASIRIFSISRRRPQRVDTGAKNISAAQNQPTSLLTAPQLHAAPARSPMLCPECTRILGPQPLEDGHGRGRRIRFDQCSYLIVQAIHHRRPLADRPLSTVVTSMRRPLVAVLPGCGQADPDALDVEGDRLVVGRALAATIGPVAELGLRLAHGRQQPHRRPAPSVDAAAGRGWRRPPPDRRTPCPTRRPAGRAAAASICRSTGPSLGNPCSRPDAILSRLPKSPLGRQRSLGP